MRAWPDWAIVFALIAGSTVLGAFGEGHATGISILEIDGAGGVQHSPKFNVSGPRLIANGSTVVVSGGKSATWNFFLGSMAVLVGQVQNNQSWGEFLLFNESSYADYVSPNMTLLNGAIASHSWSFNDPSMPNCTGCGAGTITFNVTIAPGSWHLVYINPGMVSDPAGSYPGGFVGWNETLVWTGGLSIS